MDDVCRVCLRSQEQLLPLFKNQDLIHKIESIASIELICYEGFPRKICNECLTNVNKLYNFRKVIKNSDLEIRERRETLQRTKHLLVSVAKSETETLLVKSEFSDNDYDYEPNNEDKFGENDDENSNSLDLNNHSYNVEKAEDSENPRDDSLNQNSEDSHEQSDNFFVGIFPVQKKCVCSECGKLFTSRFKLYNHRRTVHVEPGICNICGLVVRADNLRRHVLMHSEGPAECPHCGKMFKNSESLRGHLLIHRGHVFTCEKCGKTSKVRAEHRRHMKIHADPERGKLMCTLCGKKVRDLRKHMHSHTGERPHVCTYCQKGFTSPYALKVHTRQHTNERPFACHLCPTAFPQKVSLVAHLKSKHGEFQT